MPAFARRLIPACLFLSLFVLSSNAAASSVWVTSVAHDCATAPDDTVYIDVMLKDSASPIDDGVIFVSRSDNDLNFVSGARGELLAGWTGFSATKRPLGGGVEITISNATPIPAGTTGRLVRLKYLFNCCSGLYNSPHHEPIYVSGTGDFATTSFVDGQSVCMMRNPGTLSVSSGQVTCDGDSVVVRVAVKMQQSPVPVDDGGLGVYVFGANAAQFEYAGYERGDLTASWDSFDVVSAPGAAWANISGSSSTPIPAGASGTFAIILFKANCCPSSVLPWADTMVAENLVSGDLTAFNLEAGRWYCMTVPTRPITWGHVKSLYRQ